jgi:hypothetical protein
LKKVILMGVVNSVTRVSRTGHLARCKDPMKPADIGSGSGLPLQIAAIHAHRQVIRDVDFATRQLIAVKIGAASIVCP